MIVYEKLRPPQVVATRRVRGSKQARPTSAQQGAASGGDAEDAPDAPFDPDALLPRTDIGPQLNEVHQDPVTSSNMGQVEASPASTAVGSSKHRSASRASRNAIICPVIIREDRMFASTPAKWLPGLQALAKRLDHANWKERNAALEAMEEMIKAAGGRITASLGEVMPALKVRDSAPANKQWFVVGRGRMSPTLQLLFRCRPPRRLAGVFAVLPFNGAQHG